MSDLSSASSSSQDANKKPDKISVACPSCGTKLSAPTNAIGKKARCVSCKNIFVIAVGTPDQPASSVPTAVSEGSHDETPKAGDDGAIHQTKSWKCVGTLSVACIAVLLCLVGIVMYIMIPSALKRASNPTRTQSAEPSAVQPLQTLTLELDKGLTMDLILIPAGEFEMGSNDGEENEKPVHRVTISKPFYMGKYEVTQSQWQTVMGNNPSYFKGNDNLPVERVSWNDCQEFCKRLSVKSGTKVRLPTEAEWEYACRAGSNRKYCFGDSESELGEYSWYSKNSNDKTHPVGQKKANAFGLYDMYGNVWEWCQDRWGSYSSEGQTDPTGSSSGNHRVQRGGALGHGPMGCRSAIRLGFNPGFPSGNTPDAKLFCYGMRLVVMDDDSTKAHSLSETNTHAKIVNSDKNALDPKAFTVSSETASRRLQRHHDIVREVITEELKQYLNEDEANTPLYKAVLKNDADRIKRLLNEGADPNVSSPSGHTPLLAAVAKADNMAIKQLMNHSAKIDVVTSSKDTMLHVAALAGNYELVKILLDKGADVNVRNRYGETPLHNAALRGDVDIIKAILAKHPNVNVTGVIQGDNPTRGRYAPLHKAAFSGNSEAVKLLMNVEARIDELDGEGHTPLWWASTAEVAKALLQNGATLNTSNTSDELLYIACEQGRTDIATMLLKAGANPDARSPTGIFSALQWAVCRNDDEIVRLMIQGNVDASSPNYEDALLLLGKERNVRRTNSNQGTPLHTAAVWARADLCMQLCQNGADVNARNRDGKTPLQVMVDKKGYSGCSCVTETPSYKHRAILMRLSYENVKATVKALLDMKADINAKTSRGETPLGTAAYYCHRELVAYLVQRGADIQMAQTYLKQMGSAEGLKMLDAVSKNKP